MSEPYILNVEEKINFLKIDVENYSADYLFDMENHTSKQIRENTYNEANTSYGKQALQKEYDKKIALYNEIQNSKPLWFTYNPQNGECIKQ